MNYVAISGIYAFYENVKLQKTRQEPFASYVTCDATLDPLSRGARTRPEVPFILHPVLPLIIDIPGMSIKRVHREEDRFTAYVLELASKPTRGPCQLKSQHGTPTSIVKFR
jgi:hypothetical protein